MKLTFLGATHEVTGSCYYLEACGQRILIDCGMEQGKDWYVNQPIPIGAGMVDMVLLTHAHIDHSGKLPLLVKQGFKGQIFSTEGTQQLCDIMLRDSAHIQEFEAEWSNRKNERAGRDLVEPMYTTEDAQATMKCFVSLPYNEEKYIADGIRIRFVDAGHLLGSASIEVWISEEGVEKKLVFSGDLGNGTQTLIKAPEYVKDADYVVMESTYGDRAHQLPEGIFGEDGWPRDGEVRSHDPADLEKERNRAVVRFYIRTLAQVLQETFDKGGNVVIPSFAVGRTQEMLYFIREIKEKGLVKGHDGFQVWVDSPLAVDATTIFLKRMFYDFNEDAREILNRGVNPISFDGLKLAVSAEESKGINFLEEPKVIISASGMCDAGRIRHHLKHNLWRPECTVTFVGYQGEGTLGRLLLDGAQKVKLFGEEITVSAKIMQLPGISGHADNAGLMKWIGSFEQKPKMVFVTHGEDKVTEIFAGRIREELDIDSYAPFSGTTYDLAAGEFIYEAVPIPIEDEETQGTDAGREGQAERAHNREDGAAGAGKKQRREDAADRKQEERSADAGKGRGEERTDLNRSTPAYEALLAQGDALLRTIRANKGGANADLKKFASQIEELVRRWDR